MAEQEAVLTATGREQTVTLTYVLRIHGKVTDAATGRPIAVSGDSGRRAPARADVHRAQGYKELLGRFLRHRAQSRQDLVPRPDRGRGLPLGHQRGGTPRDAGPGRSISGWTPPPRWKGGSSIPGRARQGCPRPPGHALAGDLQPGRRSGNAQSTGRHGRRRPLRLPRSVRALHPPGRSRQRLCRADRRSRSRPGDLTLQPWARIQGRLLQAGKPVPDVWISFQPLRLLGPGRPHVQQDLSVETDRDGRFVFPRVPPIKGNLRAQLSVFRESPLTSSQWVPLDLRPGQTAEVELGGKGTIVRGRVALSGDAAATIDLSKSLTWLLRRAPGIEPPAEIRALGFTADRGWNNVWTDQPGGPRVPPDAAHPLRDARQGRPVRHPRRPGRRLRPGPPALRAPRRRLPGEPRRHEGRPVPGQRRGRAERQARAGRHPRPGGPRPPRR